jgi:predicted O-methyltransferase YrrM
MMAETATSSADSFFLKPSGVAFWLASRVGQHQLRIMLDEGLPHFLQSPFQFLLDRTLHPEDGRVVCEIERLRTEMAKRTDEFVGVFMDSPSYLAEQAHPSLTRSRQSSAHLRSLPYIARTSSVLPQWGVFLHLCANSAEAKTILELGGGAGISGCYLASGKHCRRFISVEGVPERVQLARINLRQVADNFELVNAPFDEALDQILPAVSEGLDMVYMDGNKDKTANLHYLERIVPFLNRGSLVIFDDIHWSPEMREMWRAVSGRQGFSYTVDAGRFGVGLWAGGIVQPKTYYLYNFACMDLYKIKQCLERLRIM